MSTPRNANVGASRPLVELEPFLLELRQTLSRSSETSVLSVIDAHNLTSLRDLCAQTATGHRKEALLRLCEADTLGVSTTLQQLNRHLKQLKPPVDQIEPVALKAQSRTGPYTVYMMFYVPEVAVQVATNECGDAHWDAGIYVVPYERFVHVLRLVSQCADACYAEILTLLFRVHKGDLDDRPIRVGRVDRSDDGSLQFFARYNMRSHRALNMVTFNTTRLPIHLCPQQWSYQPEGYDYAKWMPHWSRWCAQLDRLSGEIFRDLRVHQLTFLSVLLPGLQAFHDRPLPSGIDAVHGSWTNLTLMQRFTVSTADHCLQPLILSGNGTMAPAVSIS